MLSIELESLLSPFRLLANKAALSPQYRALELAPTHVRAVAPFGAVKVWAPLDVPETIHVDAAAFLATIASVPNAEMQLSIKDGSLAWRCGTAKGRLGLIPDVVLPEVPGSGKPNNALAELPGSAAPNIVTTEMIRAFELGALSAGGARGIGDDNLRGVVIDNRGQPMIYATDNATISVCTIGDTPLAMPELVTISEQGAELLAKMMRPGGWLSATETALVYQGKGTAAVIQQTKPMEYDLRAHIDRYDYSAEQVVEIPAERIAAFAKLASNLATKANDSFVYLTVSDGKLTLSFQGETSQMEEYYSTDEVSDFPLTDPVKLPAAKLAKALSHTNGVVVEHLEQNPVLIFCEGPFRCLVAGR